MMFVVYEYKGNNYIWVGEGKMKDPNTREWIECVYYRDTKGGEMYAREKEEFYDRFERKNKMLSNL